MCARYRTLVRISGPPGGPEKDDEVAHPIVPPARVYKRSRQACALAHQCGSSSTAALVPQSGRARNSQHWCGALYALAFQSYGPLTRPAWPDPSYNKPFIQGRPQGLAWRPFLSPPRRGRRPQMIIIFSKTGPLGRTARRSSILFRCHGPAT